MKPLVKAVQDYLTMRRGLGFKLVRHETALREFLLFLAQKRSAAITVKLALEWAIRHENQKPYEWAARLSIVRGFTRHWSATDPATEIPPRRVIAVSTLASSTLLLLDVRDSETAESR